MAIEWSERQKSAIFTKDKNILVSASAGSGKTAVLSERIVNLVMDEHIDIDKFVVVTFTRLAASEMKTRIAKKLNKRKENATKEEKDFIDEQIILLEKANISTLDSFNISLLRDYFYMIDLEPNFKVIDNVDNELLAKDIMDKLFDKYYKEHDEKFLKLIAMYSAERTDDGLKNVIRELYNYITNVPDSDYVLDNLLNEYDAENIENSIYYKTFKEYANKILDEYINDLKDYIDIHDILLNELKLLKDLKDAINESYDKAYDIIYAKEKFETLRFPKDTDESTKTYVKKIREDYKAFFDKLKKKYFKSNSEKFKEEVSYMKPYLERLVSLTKEYKEMLFNDKKKNNIYDFNDLAHLTIKLLVDDNGNPTDIAKSLKNTYSYIICDEYQDVNLIQETILNAIARSGKESNMFMVGDVKQSIYGFRNADSDIFTNKYNDYKSNRDDNNMKIDLNQNYRSRIEVLNSINYVFEKIMLSDIGGIEYDEEMALRYGDGYIENDMDHKTEFIILPTAKYLNQKAKEENKETNANDNSNDENQSDEISEEINELKNGIIQAK
ncbi:MAG: UvrD-helicase domain-containing protein, partial [Clostridia bacterium]|nr:UvrD-helicase domain-containing protein [Clostridia bacterium]